MSHTRLDLYMRCRFSREIKLNNQKLENKIFADCETANFTFVAVGNTSKGSIGLSLESRKQLKVMMRKCRYKVGHHRPLFDYFTQFFSNNFDGE